MFLETVPQSFNNEKESPDDEILGTLLRQPPATCEASIMALYSGDPALFLRIS
jgi:hypothetical protein